MTGLEDFGFSPAYMSRPIPKRRRAAMYPETKLVIAFVAAICFGTAVFAYVESLVRPTAPRIEHASNLQCFPPNTDMSIGETFDGLAWGGCIDGNQVLVST